MYIPPAFRQHAEIVRDALLIGIVTRFELWSPKQWELFVEDEAWRL